MLFLLCADGLDCGWGEGGEAVVEELEGGLLGGGPPE